VGPDRSELIRALGAFLDAPTDELAAAARSLGLPELPGAGEHTRIFVLNLYPYASVHLGPEGMLGGEARDRVGGYWAAVGLMPPPEPDHLGAMLGLWASLLDRRDQAEEEAQRLLLDRAQQAFADEHLLPWVGVYLHRVKETADPFYAAWAGLLEEVLAEADQGGDWAPPVWLEGAPGLEDPREGQDGSGQRLLEGILAPLRTGIIVTREDLTRAGREMGLGVRIGERAYSLKALMGQEPRSTLLWLAGEARRQWETYDTLAGVPSAVIVFWRERALATAELLEKLASSDALEEWATPVDTFPPTMESNNA